MGNIYTGSNFLIEFGSETSFNAGSGLNYGTLGAGMKLSTYEIKNNFEPVYTLGQRYPEAWYSKGVSVDVSSDFYLTDDTAESAGWLDYVLTGGTPNTSGYNTTWTPGLTVATGYTNIQSYYSAYDMYSVSGIVFDTAKLNVKQGAIAQVTLTGTGTQESTTTPSSGIVVTPPTNVLTWKDATVQIGTTLAGFSTPIQELDMTITTSKELLYGLGELTYQGYYLKQFKVDGTLSVYHDSDIMGTIFEADSAATEVTLADQLKLVIGGYTFTITGMVRNEGSMEVPPVDEVVDKLSFDGTYISVAYA